MPTRAWWVTLISLYLLKSFLLYLLENHRQLVSKHNRLITGMKGTKEKYLKPKNDFNARLGCLYITLSPSQENSIRISNLNLRTALFIVVVTSPWSRVDR